MVIGRGGERLRKGKKYWVDFYDRFCYDTRAVFNNHFGTCIMKSVMLLTAIFTTFSFITQAQSLSARQIYSYAKNGNIDALKNLGNTI